MAIRWARMVRLLAELKFSPYGEPMNYYANCAAVDQKSPHMSDPPLNKKPG